jgi:hypothetical protein
VTSLVVVPRLPRNAIRPGKVTTDPVDDTARLARSMKSYDPDPRQPGLLATIVARVRLGLQGKANRRRRRGGGVTPRRAPKGAFNAALLIQTHPQQIVVRSPGKSVCD